MPKIKPQFYTSDEVAALLCCSKQTLYNKISQNRLNNACHALPPYIKHGGKTLFPIYEFHSWLERQTLIFNGKECH
ncbi:helix-turn-helix domain-containing protein [Shewanella algae]|uniref:helix-turn-helix domain-containing protein n=1 Tax=Shewanella algae TaxID=38313 RepID=UPI0031F4D406